MVVHIFEVFFVYVLLNIQRDLAMVFWYVDVLLEVQEQSGGRLVELLPYLVDLCFGEEGPPVIRQIEQVFFLLFVEGRLMFQGDLGCHQQLLGNRLDELLLISLRNLEAGVFMGMCPIFGFQNGVIIYTWLSSCFDLLELLESVVLVLAVLLQAIVYHVLDYGDSEDRAHSIHAHDYVREVLGRELVVFVRNRWLLQHGRAVALCVRACHADAFRIVEWVRRRYYRVAGAAGVDALLVLAIHISIVGALGTLSWGISLTSFVVLGHRSGIAIYQFNHDDVVAFFGLVFNFVFDILVRWPVNTNDNRLHVVHELKQIIAGIERIGHDERNDRQAPLEWVDEANQRLWNWNELKRVLADNEDGLLFADQRRIQRHDVFDFNQLKETIEKPRIDESQIVVRGNLELNSAILKNISLDEIFWTQIVMDFQTFLIWW